MGSKKLKVWMISNMKRKKQPFELRCEWCHRIMNSIYENGFKIEDDNGKKSFIDEIADRTGFKGFVIHDYHIDDFLHMIETMQYKKKDQKQLTLFKM